MVLHGQMLGSKHSDKCLGSVSMIDSQAPGYYRRGNERMECNTKQGTLKGSAWLLGPSSLVYNYR